MGRPPPYVPRRGGDPLVAADWNEVLHQHTAALEAHDHSAGRGAPLHGGSFDAQTDAVLGELRLSGGLHVGGVDVGAALEGAVPRAGGTVRGALAVEGLLRVEGPVRLAPDAPLGGQRAGDPAELHNQHPAEASMPERAGTAPCGVAAPEALTAMRVELELPQPTVVLVQLVAGFQLRVEQPWWSPTLALLIERGGRWALLGDRWEQPTERVDAALVEGPVELPERLLHGGARRASATEASGAWRQNTPITLTWLFGAEAGALALTPVAAGLGAIWGGLTVTTLPELDHV